MIRRGFKVPLFIGCAVLASAASWAGLAGVTPVSLAAGATQWSLAGGNSIDIGYDSTSLVYSVTFTQNGSTLGGTLNDPYYPVSGTISGTVSGNSVTFTFNYPPGSIQGTRTYTGSISGSGAVSGDWTQTGP